MIGALFFLSGVPEKVTQPPVTRLQKQLPGSAQEENQR
jgi:hypothetical protein